MEGGLRRRYISESVRIEIIASLDLLGWFGSTRYDDPPGTRQHRPVHYSLRPDEAAEQVLPNTFSITLEDRSDDEFELGFVEEDTYTFFLDFFGESAPIAAHFAWDVHDVVLGKMPDVGRTQEAFDFFDLSQASPAPFHVGYVERCSVHPVPGLPRPWQRDWWTVRFDVVDDHADDPGDIEWSVELQEAWDLIQSGGSDG